MLAPVHEAAVRLGWSSGLCRGTAAEQTLPVLGHHPSTPSEHACLPPAPQNHSHTPVREEGEKKIKGSKAKRLNVQRAPSCTFLVKDVGKCGAFKIIFR